MARVMCLVSDYSGLQDAIRKRRFELGLSQLDLDHVCGWPQGYTGKIEARPGTGSDRGNFRALGPQSLPELLHALGLTLAIVADDEALPGVTRLHAGEAAA